MLTELLKLQEQIQLKLADLERNIQRENVRIYRVPEGAEGSSAAVLTFVEKLMQEKLEIPPTTGQHIERAHRALVPQPPQESKPRWTTVRFLSYQKKDVLKKSMGNEWIYMEK